MASLSPSLSPSISSSLSSSLSPSLSSSVSPSVSLSPSLSPSVSPSISISPSVSPSPSPEQPQSTDPLDSPDHALAHRVIANYPSAPAKSLVVDNSGNVGIGTTTPIAKLSVKGGGTGTGRLLQLTDSANTERVTVLDNGNVGIGTTSPGAILDITKSGDDLIFLNLRNPNSGEGYQNTYLDMSAENYKGIRFYDYDGTTLKNSMIVDGDGNMGFGIVDANAYYHIYSESDVAGSRVFYLQAPASVGINHLDFVLHNTNSNSANRQARFAFLHGGSGFAGGYIDSGRDATGGGDSGKYTHIGDADSDLRFATAANGTNAEHMRIMSSGNVGIGTASPDELLHVDGTVQTGAQVNIVAGAGATAFLDFKADSGTNANDIAYISKVNNGNFVFSNDNNHGFQGFVIDVSGNVGIGTTEPAAPLHILSELASDNVGFRIGKEALDEYFFAGIDVTGNNIAYIGSAYGNDANRFDIRMKGFAATDAKLTVLGDGNVGIGLTGPSAQCHIDQSSGTGAKPVLTLDQGDVSEEFIKLIGTSAVDNTQSFVDATDLTTPGNIMGWIRVYIQDDAASGAISDGIYFVPFYSTPTA